MKNYYLVLIFCTFISCSLFTPREVDEPETPNVFSDPYNFDEIISPSRERFNNVDYNSLFSDNFEYRNASFSCDKNLLLSRLQDTTRINNLNEQYIIRSCHWSLPENGSPPVSLSRTRANEVVIEYFVNVDKMQKESGVLIESIQFRGTSTFTIVYSNVQGGWIISRWVDTPNDGVPNSFFSPNFN